MPVAEGERILGGLCLERTADEPFDERPLSDRDVNWILQHKPFSEIADEEFRGHSPLAEILRNDARIVRCMSGDVVYRTGDFGTSATKT